MESRSRTCATAAAYAVQFWQHCVGGGAMAVACDEHRNLFSGDAALFLNGHYSDGTIKPQPDTPTLNPKCNCSASRRGLIGAGLDPTQKPFLQVISLTYMSSVRGHFRAYSHLNHILVGLGMILAPKFTGSEALAPTPRAQSQSARVRRAAAGGS